eukprot:52633_1
MHIELVLLILSILCMVSTSAITTSCIGLVPNGLWFNRPSDSFPEPRVPTDCLPLCNPPPANTSITDNCYPICNPSASPTPIIINCRTLPQCSASITTNCMCNGGNMPTGCYYPTQTMPTSCNPSTCVNAAEYQYDDYMVMISGLIRYEAGNGWMGSKGNGLIATFGNQAQCPSRPEIFTATNGWGLDCTVEILWNTTSNACEIYLLSWNIPMLYYYTGAYKNYPFHGTPVTQAFYVVNSLRFLEIGPAIEECKCTDPPTDHCAKIYVNGATTPTCLEPRNTRFVSLDGIVYVPRNNPVQTSSRVGSIQFATRQSSNQKVWDNAKRNERIINQATYHYNGNMVSLSGLLNYTGTGVMGSELQGNIGYIDNAQVCPSNQEIFAVSNGRGVDCSVQIEPATANTCPIDLLAWSIPVAVYYTGAVSGFTQSFYVADNVELMKASTGATNCACGKPNPTRNECFRIWVGNNEPACLPGDKLSLVSLDDIQFTSATIDGTPSYGTGDPHFTLWDGSRHHLQGRARLKPQFYYIISCDIRNKALLPYTMIGKHININSRSKISRLHYVTLELFDNNNNNYLVFLSSSLRHYTIETD